MDGAALDAATFLVLQLVLDLGFQAVALTVAQVHAFQHAGPVASLGPAGACMDGEKAVVLVELAREHGLQPELLEILVQVLDLLVDLRLGVRIVGFGGIQVNQLLRLVDLRDQLFPRLIGILQVRELAEKLVCVFLVVPEAVLGCLGLELRDLVLDVGVVKDASILGTLLP